MKNEENLAYFLNEAKNIKPRELGKKLRVAFLASSTINGFEETMRVKCYQKGIDCITYVCLLYTSPSPRDKRQSRMPSSA